MIFDELFEDHQTCPKCGGPAFSDLIVAEKKDACYNKVRSRYKVWPSAYASGALVQCRKKGAANWGNKAKKESVSEGTDWCGICGQTPCNCTHVVTESLADDFMKLAKEKGLNPRLAGTPEQERERTQQMLAQRAKDREEQQRQSAAADAAKLPELQTQYDDMLKKYNSLGGSNWQYADREQNLSDQEREARRMEPALNDLGARLARAKAHSGLEETKPEEKIGGRYDPDDFDAMVLRLKKLAGAGPMKTVYDPEKRVYKNVPQSSEKK